MPIAPRPPRIWRYRTRDPAGLIITHGRQPEMSWHGSRASETDDFIRPSAEREGNQRANAGCRQEQLTHTIFSGKPLHRLTQFPIFAPNFIPKFRNNPSRSFLISMLVDCRNVQGVSSILISWLRSVFVCTGRNRPKRISCAIPRASFRSILLIWAERAAFMWRVSTLETE